MPDVRYGPRNLVPDAPDAPAAPQPEMWAKTMVTWYETDPEIIAVGRKGRDYFRKRPVKIIGDWANIFGKLEFSHAQEIARQIIDLYSRQSVDAVDFLYNEFKSVLTQRLTIERYLPIKPVKPAKGEAPIDYLYEQTPAEIFNVLLPRYVEIQGGKRTGPVATARKRDRPAKVQRSASPTSRGRRSSGQTPPTCFDSLEFVLFTPRRRAECR